MWTIVGILHNSISRFHDNISHHVKLLNRVRIYPSRAVNNNINFTFSSPGIIITVFLKLYPSQCQGLGICFVSLISQRYQVQLKRGGDTVLIHKRVSNLNNKYMLMNHQPSRNVYYATRLDFSTKSHMYYIDQKKYTISIIVQRLNGGVS